MEGWDHRGKAAAVQCSSKPVMFVPSILVNGRDSPTQLGTEVVMVGAGLSGLQAARDLQEAGISCMVLEANDRVGGKTLSLPSSEGSVGKVDVGAAWINDTNQSHMYELAKRFGFNLKIQRATGFSIAQKVDGSVAKLPYGSLPGSEEEKAVLMDFIRVLEEMVAERDLEDPLAGPRAKELDGMTLKEFGEKFSGAPIVREFLTSLAQGFLGVEAEEMSALFFLDYVKSGTSLANMSTILQEPD